MKETDNLSLEELILKIEEHAISEV